MTLHLTHLRFDEPDDGTGTTLPRWESRHA